MDKDSSEGQKNSDLVGQTKVCPLCMGEGD